MLMLLPCPEVEREVEEEDLQWSLGEAPGVQFETRAMPFWIPVVSFYPPVFVTGLFHLG
jgi:hypothetical protein